MTSKTPELRECPFCASKAEQDLRGYVNCSNEGCFAFWKLRRVTPSEWNTRTPTNHDDYDEAAQAVGLL